MNIQERLDHVKTLCRDLAAEVQCLERHAEALAELRANDALMPPTIDAIKLCVCRQYGLEVSTIEKRSRKNSVAHPRMVAMFFARELTKYSLQEIGEQFGKRDHGTVIHACRWVNVRCELEPKFKAVVSRIRSELSGDLAEKTA